MDLDKKTDNALSVFNKLRFGLYIANSLTVSLLGLLSVIVDGIAPITIDHHYFGDTFSQEARYCFRI